ncbi:hypothetical protein AAMO2058_001070300 [Amorphochlora amoebiformis]
MASAEKAVSVRKRKSAPVIGPGPAPLRQLGAHAAVWGSFYEMKTGKWGYACCRSLVKGGYCKATQPPESMNADYMEPLETTKVTKKKKIGPSMPSNFKPELSLLDDLLSRQDQYEKLRHKHDFKSSDEFLSYTLKHLLLTWSLSADAREASSTTSTPKYGSYDQKGAREVATGIEKLTKLIAVKRLNTKILQSLSDIFEHVTHNRFLMANKLYFDMSIGKEPWPIGVGERNTFEQGKMRGAKFRRNIILHDEEYRHLVLQVKRLLGFAQQHYSD